MSGDEDDAVGAPPGEGEPGFGMVEPADPPDVGGHIARQLKALYDGVLNQTVPDRFLELMRQLDSSEGGP